jgi:predicted AAA+ superfamily ATPase
MSEVNSPLLPRALSGELRRLSGVFSAVVVTGPRQAGKTTLCRATFPDYTYYNLERPDVCLMIEESPAAFLEANRKGVIIDEVQRLPELLSYAQALIDEQPDSRLIFTGSSNFSLLSGVTQSLAGRAAMLTLLPMALSEYSSEATGLSTDELLLRGGYPAVWSRNVPPDDLYRQYYNTYIERDVRQLLNVKDLSKFQRFIRLCAARIGTEFNASALSNEVGVAVTTIQHWLSVLEASYIILRLPPFHRNIGKRLVKSPKIYFADTGLLCFLLGISTPQHLAVHPLRGSIFENFVVLEFFKSAFHSGKLPQLYFYKDKSQREVDLIVDHHSGLAAYEIKSARSYHEGFFATLDYLKKLLPDEVQTCSVVYDGEYELRTEVKQVLRFTSLSSLLA